MSPAAAGSAWKLEAWPERAGEDGEGSLHGVREDIATKGGRESWKRPGGEEHGQGFRTSGGQIHGFINTGQGQQTDSCKEPECKYFRVWGHLVSVTMTQVCG